MQLTPDGVIPFRIVSGGQTGVDRAGLDAATDAGIDAAGWCPRGRMAEDGRIADHYALRETPSSENSERTRWNVRDSDATVVLHIGRVGGGTALARAEAQKLGRKLLEVDLRAPDAIIRIVEWIRMNRIRVLNLAGPRESEEPGIYELARRVLGDVFGLLRPRE